MSYEKEIQSNLNDISKDRLDISLIKFFWQISTITGRGKSTLPRFLRNIEVLKNFTDNELRILGKFLHERNFQAREIIFRQGDLGIGFYFIFSGEVDIVVEDEYTKKDGSNYVLTLEKYDYFGELSLLQENSIRSATAIAKEPCTLIGIFKPDVDELINNYPIVAAKLLQSISVIVANRLFAITKEVRSLKDRVFVLEKASESNGK